MIKCVILLDYFFSLNKIRLRSILVFVCINSFFPLLLHGLPWLMEHSLLHHPTVEGHMCCFLCLAVTNKALRSIHVQDFVCEDTFLFLWDKCPGVQLLGHGVRTYLVSQKLPNCFQRSYTILHSQQQCMSDPVLPHLMLSAFDVVFLKKFGHSDRCVVIICHGLFCISLIVNDADQIFMYLDVTCKSSSGKCLFMPFNHFLIYLLLFFSTVVLRFLYIVQI